MASASSSTAAHERGRKRKRDSAGGGDTELHPSSRWRTRREHEIYSSKLLDALRLVRTGREVRDAADRALAVAARGRSLWSRAILVCRRRRGLRVRLRAPRRPVLAAADCQLQLHAADAGPEGEGAGAAGARLRKLPFPALLAEASDYIAALEMQVRAMTALAQALSSVSAAGGSSSPA